jgi:hypothetical protein
LRHRIGWRCRRDILWLLVFRAEQEVINFRGIEPGEIEVEIDRLQLSQFKGHQLRVPLRKVWSLVFDDLARPTVNQLVALMSGAN